MPRDQLVQVRRGTAAQWELANPTLANGEIGFESDYNRFKVGDGFTPWIILDYAASQENFVRVENATGSALYKGQAVCFDVYNSINETPLVRTCIADGTNKQSFWGLLDRNIMAGYLGTVKTYGILSDLDTRGSAVTNFGVGSETWSVGDILYLHPNQYGKLTKVRPQHSIMVAIVLYVDSLHGKLFVKPFVNPSLAHLSDIAFNGLLTDDLLKYNPDGTFKNTNSLDGGLI